MTEGNEAEDSKEDKRNQQVEQVNGCCHDELMEVVQVTDRENRATTQEWVPKRWYNCNKMESQWRLVKVQVRVHGGEKCAPKEGMDGEPKEGMDGEPKDGRTQGRWV